MPFRLFSARLSISHMDFPAPPRYNKTNIISCEERTDVIKAIFFDVDGTLVSFKTHRVPDSTLNALHRLKEQGVKLFLCTGRHPFMVRDLMELFPFDGMVAFTGQYCSLGDQVLYHNPMPADLMEQLSHAIEQYNFPAIYFGGDEIFTLANGPFVDFFMRTFTLPQPPIRPLAHTLKVPVYQVVIALKEEEEAEKLRPFAPFLNGARWHPDFLDALPQGGGKDVGMQVMMDHLGIQRSEVMAFGDGGNDLPMLLHAGIGVAMGTASDDVKAQSDYVTDSVDEDGVVNALKHFGLL